FLCLDSLAGDLANVVGHVFRLAPGVRAAPARACRLDSPERRGVSHLVRFVSTGPHHRGPGSAASGFRMRERLSGSAHLHTPRMETPVTGTLPVWFEITSLVVVLLILAFDLTIAYKRPHVPSTKESSLWVTFYVSLALVFAALVLWLGGGEIAGQFIA